MEGIGVKGKQTSAWELSKRVYKANGIKGLYKANLACILRETFGWSSQFAAYEGLRALFNKYSTDYKMLCDFVAGGLSGVVGWIFQYPQDIVKSKLSMDLAGTKYPHYSKFRDGGLIECTKEIWRKEGMRGVWTGFSACQIRAVIANAFTFLAYEQAKAMLL